MADKNVQIQQRNATNDGWDSLYPKTKAALVETDVNNRFVTDAKITAWDKKQDALSAATATTAGTMSAADKDKLDKIAAGATANTATATTSANGLMSSTDKSKLDGLSTISVVATAPTTGTSANQIIFLQA